MENLITIDDSQVTEHRQTASKALDWARTVVITDKESYEAVSDGALQVNAKYKAIKGWMESITQPIKDALKNTEASLSPILEPFKEADKILKGKMEVWVRAEYARKEAEALAEKKRAEEEQALGRARMRQLINLGFLWNKAENRFEREGETPIYLAQMTKDPVSLWDARILGIVGKLPPTPKENVEGHTESLPVIEQELKVVEKENLGVKSKAGTTYTVERWVVECVDLSLVPIELHAFDQKKANELVAQGVREIAGCVIKKEIDVRRRTK